MSGPLYAAIIEPDDGDLPSVSVHRTREGAIATLLEEALVDWERGQDGCFWQVHRDEGYDRTRDAFARVFTAVMEREGSAFMDRSVYMVTEAWPGPDMEEYHGQG